MGVAAICVNTRGLNEGPLVGATKSKGHWCALLSVYFRAPGTRANEVLSSVLSSVMQRPCHYSYPFISSLNAKCKACARSAHVTLLSTSHEEAFRSRDRAFIAK